MKTLIIYASKHGCAERAANILYEKLNDNKDIINIRENSKPNISNYDSVIIGGSIYGGNIQKEIKNFVDKNIDLLLTKRLGLFLSCGVEKQYKEQLKKSFPDEIIKHATTDGYFGYEFNRSKMNLIEKTLVKIVAKSKNDVSKINIDNIEKFVKEIQGV